MLLSPIAHTHTAQQDEPSTRKIVHDVQYEANRARDTRASAWQSAHGMVREGHGMIERIKSSLKEYSWPRKASNHAQSRSAIINMASRYLDNFNLEVANFVGLCRAICRA